MKRHPVRLLVLAATSALTALALIGPADAATTPYCGITWGSLAKSAGSGPGGPGQELTAARVGQHTCYDRLVLDVAGTTHLNSWRVAYVDAVRSDGSGAVVPLKGGAFLQISLGVNNVTAPPASSGDVAHVSGFRTFREVAAAGGFEGHTSEGLGVRARLPFRVFTLSGPGSTTRLVIDVAHAW